MEPNVLSPSFRSTLPPRMAEGVRGKVVDLEEGRLSLPADTRGVSRDSKQYRRVPLETTVPRQNHSKVGWKSHHKSKYPSNKSSTRGGPGMHAIFIESGQRSCGTGVFLPRGVGAESQTNKKPGCSTVFVPSRVVQALNLNVHELGSCLSSQRKLQSNVRSKKEVFSEGNNNNDLENELVHGQNSSPENFLPKEWTY